VRVSKLLTERGLASRREADDWIDAGWVKRDGRPAVLGQRAATRRRDRDRPARAPAAGARVTMLLHKPVGYVSGQAEDGHEPAVVLVTPANRWREATSSRIRPSTPATCAAWRRPAGWTSTPPGLLVLTQDGRIAKLLIGDDAASRRSTWCACLAPRADQGPCPRAQL
jgi:23S rRNA pseudouridine2604 synthase